MQRVLFSIFHPLGGAVPLLSLVRAEMDTTYPGHNFVFLSSPLPRLRHPLLPADEFRLDPCRALEAMWLNGIVPHRDGPIGDAFARDMNVVLPCLGLDLYLMAAVNAPEERLAALAHHHHNVMVVEHLKKKNVSPPTYFHIAFNADEEFARLRKDERFSSVTDARIRRYLERRDAALADYFSDRYAQLTPIRIDGTLPPGEIAGNIVRMMMFNASQEPAVSVAA